MSRYQTLKQLESVLESFLARAMEKKTPRLEILSGINRLDDIARSSESGFDITDDIGQWFAGHNRLMESRTLRRGDTTRIDRLLGDIRERLTVDAGASPAAIKIVSEIDRWRKGTADDRRLAAESSHIPLRPSESVQPAEAPAEGTMTSGVTFKRGPEERPADRAESVERFARVLEGIVRRYDMVAAGKNHLLAVLDALLNSATLGRNREALMLAAFIIYFLKQSGYKVEPYVARLKQAERVQRGEVGDRA